MNPADWVTDENGKMQRLFGASESAFYPASSNGLGDMFLHLAFTAPRACLCHSRVVLAWAIIRHRHPLLRSQVITTSDSEDDNASMPCFSYSSLSNCEGALKEASESLFFKKETKDELISNFMNGPRTLCDEKLSYLIISLPEDGKETNSEFGEYDLLMCAPHFTGDGTSLHQSTHDFLSLLASPLSPEQLSQELDFSSSSLEKLPPAFETRCLQPRHRLARAASRINFLQTLEKEIGGHSFPRHQTGPRKTVIFERDFTESQTSAILKRCKSHKVTINHVLSALCNVVWSRMVAPESFRDPMMMYAAINLRHCLEPHSTSTYWFLALTYFNVVLPSFPPATREVFWHRARLVKSQTGRAVRSRFLTSRALQMSGVRARRAQGLPDKLPSFREASTLSLPPAPSTALVGLSLIGNLDGIYLRSLYPSFSLRSVTTASRQKEGGVLLLQHTFGGKLWLNLCWDRNGFRAGLMESFWEGLQSAVDEFLID